MVILVEVCNILQVCMAPDVPEVIMNFIALAIISEFDDIFYSGLPKVEFKKINNKLTIMKTSSP